MNKNDKSKKMKYSEVIRRMTWGQRILYITFPVVVLAIIFLNVRTILRLSMSQMRNDGIIQATALRDSVEEYLYVAEETVDNLARNVEYMQTEGASKEEIVGYMGVQTDIVSDVMAEDTTGLYGYINGEYMDSLWEPDEDYDPKSRPWYQEAAAAGGEIIYVSPYIDMQTNDAMVTVAMLLPDQDSVVAIDFRTNRLQTILSEIDFGDNSYGMIIDQDGTVVAHPDASQVGVNYLDTNDALGKAIVTEIRKDQQNTYVCSTNGHRYVFMIEDLGGSWYSVAVTEMADILKDVLPTIVLTVLFSVAGTIAVIIFTMRLAANRIQSEEYNQSLHSLADIYVSMHSIDLEWNTYEEISTSLIDLTNDLDYRGGDAKNAFRKVIGKMTDESNRKDMLEFMDFDTLNDRLKNTDTITMEYLSVAGYWRRARFIVADRDPDGRVISVLYAVEEIDEEKRQRDDLINHSKAMEEARSQAEKARHEAEAANEAKSHFLANMSHEIRTPINTVLGLDTMILRETDDEEIREYAMDIQSAGQSLLSIINDILDLSKIESGKMEIIPVEYDVASMVHDVVNMITPRANSKGLEFKINITDDIPSKLFGDNVRIRQVLINLLTNAVKYTHEGSVTLSVRCVRLTDNKVRMYASVKDTGIGIAEEDLEKLFQAFVRIEEKRNRSIEGTGLGINICTQLLKLMGSRLEVKSVYGEGSDFYFSLVQEVVDASPVGDLEQKIRERTMEYSYETNYIMPDVKLLVVDDNAMNRFVFKELLKDFECQIDEADGGRQSLVMAAKTKYDVIFMDHMMPDIDGVEAFHRIRDMEDGLNKDTPVIVLTANAISGAKEQYMEEGFTDFLSKPIVPERLEKMIGTLIPDERKKPADHKKKEKEAAASDRNASGKSAKDKLPEVEGIDWDYALLKLQKVELLKNVVADLSKAADGDIGLLRKQYQSIMETGDADAYNAYRIKVHAMKSSSAMIGATHVSALAKVLEYAARDQERETIEAVMGIFDKEWTKLKEHLDTAFDLNQPEEETEAVEKTPYNPETLKGTLDQMSEAMDGLDFDTAESLLSELEPYEYGEKGNQLFKDMKDAVFNMDVDACLEIIESWTAELE